MSKYIIELDDRIKLVTSVGVTENGVVYTTSDYVHNLEELNSDYINEHYGELQNDAYKRGLSDVSAPGYRRQYEDGYRRGYNNGRKVGIKDGMCEAWEAARKLFSSMADSDIEKAFPIEWNNGGFKALMNLQPQEAIAKLKAYEDKHSDRIEVGDEVRTRDGAPSHTFLVTKVTDSHVYGISDDGSWNYWTKDEVAKTGKHYDIASILEAMRE